MNKTHHAHPTQFELIVDLVSLAERPRWHAEAACRGVGPDMFFPTRGESVAGATAYCNQCPVTAQCLDSALEFRDPGIWAGTSGRQRRRIRRLPTERQRHLVTLEQQAEQHREDQQESA